jgi:alkanesulfonate monooxygenase SsuD/methylene tetrahydromethanopterin reductase-like flavin-dependent oxidoreductase (luciferase family)
MKLSVLEQSSLSESSTAAEAISNTVVLSKELDRLGYSRIWVSEHHNLKILQGSTPPRSLADGDWRSHHPYSPWLRWRHASKPIINAPMANYPG